MMRQSRRRILIEAVHDAAGELAAEVGSTLPNPTVLISDLAIFERVRLTIPNVTRQEVRDAIMQSLPHVGRRQ
jgi:hypothetical protein